VGSGGATANSDLGRRTKEQKTAQRPAIRVRLRLLQGVRIKLPGTFIAPLPACDLPLYLNFASQLQRAVLKGIMVGNNLRSDWINVLDYLHRYWPEWHGDVVPGCAGGSTDDRQKSIRNARLPPEPAESHREQY
jgi:hypothetical protein